MNVRFIDTSILTNLLDIPTKNQQKDQVWREFKEAVENSDTLILPIAAIIETGNFIAHIDNGEIRRNRAIKFSEYLSKTATDQAPWTFYGNGFSKEDLTYFSLNITDHATRKIGIGDISIIRQYNIYKDTVPSIGRIMIWSIDAHLSTYHQDNVSMTRRRNK